MARNVDNDIRGRDSTNRFSKYLREIGPGISGRLGWICGGLSGSVVICLVGVSRELWHDPTGLSCSPIGILTQFAKTIATRVYQIV